MQEVFKRKWPNNQSKRVVMIVSEPLGGPRMHAEVAAEAALYNDLSCYLYIWTTKTSATVASQSSFLYSAVVNRLKLAARVVLILSINIRRHILQKLCKMVSLL